MFDRILFVSLVRRCGNAARTAICIIASSSLGRQRRASELFPVLIFKNGSGSTREGERREKSRGNRGVGEVEVEGG